MKKSDYKFNKNIQRQIKEDETPNKPKMFWHQPKPIFTPKRKKFKK